MTNLLFLLAALGVIALGTLILALRAREPKGFDSGIKAHQRHMNALSTETRKDSTGIDRIQPVRRVDPLTGPPDGAGPGGTGQGETGPPDGTSEPEGTGQGETGLRDQPRPRASPQASAPDSPSDPAPDSAPDPAQESAPRSARRATEGGPHPTEPPAEG